MRRGPALGLGAALLLAGVAAPAATPASPGTSVALGAAASSGTSIALGAAASSGAAASFSRSSKAAPGLETAAWWNSFGDPLLDRLMTQAAQGSLTVRQAQARVRQARAGLGSAKAAQWPTASASASLTRSRDSANALTPGLPAATTTLYQAGFDASWELDFLGGKQKAASAALARYEASLDDLGSARLTLMGEVASNYMVLRGTQALLEITRQNLEVQRQTVQLTGERLRLGLTSSLDVAQAKAQLASTSAGLPALEASILQAIHRLGVLCGQDPTGLLGELAPRRDLPSARGAIAPGLPAELLARRPDLRSAERNLAATLADVGVAKADLYPKFDLTLGLGLQSLDSASFTSSSSRYGSIVPGLSLPIFNRGALKAAVAKKQALYEESLAAFQASYHTALEDVENALASYYSEVSQHRDLEEAALQSQEALALARERYRLGLTSFLDVLTAQASLQTSQGSLCQSETRVLTDLVALYKALGGGWAAPAVASS